jgi:hypothetical protein
MSAEKTPAAAPHPTPVAATTPVASADMMTEQEKDPSGGVGPISPAEHSPGPVETIEALGIGPRTPYPEGNPPPPSAEDRVRIEAAKQAPAPEKKKEPVR